MTSKEFVIWLKGFSKAANSYNITPAQWDEIQEELAKVSDDKFVETPGMFQYHPEPPYPGVPNTTPPTINPYYIGDPPGWMQPFTTTGANTDFKFTATNGQSGSL